MSEKFNPEQGFTPEDLEDQKYKQYQEAEAEISRIMRDIENVLSSNPDRSEAEKIIVKSIAPMMDKALKQLDESYKEWIELMQKNIKKESSD